MHGSDSVMTVTVWSPSEQYGSHFGTSAVTVKLPSDSTSNHQLQELTHSPSQRTSTAALPGKPVPVMVNWVQKWPEEGSRVIEADSALTGVSELTRKTLKIRRIKYLPLCHTTFPYFPFSDDYLHGL